MRRAGWKLPRHSSVIPYHLSAVESLPTNLPKVSEGDVRNPSHLVFFGRLEGRKGIDIFLKALASERLRQYEFRLTFLGRPASLSASEIEETIAQSRPDLLPGLRIQTDLTSDEAQLFLTQNDCVVVIPSLLDNSPCVVYESIRLKLPLIASASGGIGELIHQDDHARCLFPPTADHLARKIEEVLSAEIWEPARPSYEMSQVADAWLSWFSQLASQGEVLVSDRVDAAPKPDVSVVLVHYERPKLLQQCLQALASQTDSDFDLIVVDDGSRSEEARAALRRIEGGFPGLRLKLVRQENKHAGAARNAGLRHVTTACVIFQDDDNVPFPNMVEVFRNAIHASNADVVSCQMRMFRDSSKEPNARLHGEERYAFPGGPVALGFLDNVFGDATSIFRRKVFDDTGSFTEERQLAYEDWHMYLRAVLCGCRLLSIPEPLYWYRVSPDSIQRTAASYESMRIIASVVQSQSFPALAPLVDLAIGRLRPLMLDEYGQKPQGPTVARYGADRESVLDDRIDNLKRQVDAIYGSRIWKGLTWLGGVIQKVTPGSHPRKKGL
jgi:GT2 family glycosyltransferase